MPTISSGWCLTFILEMPLGANDLLEDELKMALYDDTRDLDADTLQSYVTTGEVSGVGYTVGGAPVTVELQRTKSVLAVHFEAVWDMLKTDVRSALIYNTVNNRAVLVLDLQTLITSTSRFTLRTEKLPPYSGFIEEVI